jgi:hypothetical protein
MGIYGELSSLQGLINGKASEIGFYINNTPNFVSSIFNL